MDQNSHRKSTMQSEREKNYLQNKTIQLHLINSDLEEQGWGTQGDSGGRMGTQGDTGGPDQWPCYVTFM